MSLSRRLLIALAFALTLAPATHAGAGVPAPLADVPFRLHDNRILVDVMLDGHGPFTMVFDTGGANVMTPECQRRLGLATRETGTSAGAGEHRVAVGAVKVASMKVGELELRDQDFAVVDLGGIRRAFRFPKLDGIVGFELLQRARASVDFGSMRLRFSEPAADSSLGANAARFQLVNDRPVIEGRIAGVPATILVDTGDRSNLTVFRQFAESSGLDSLFAGHPEVPTGVGIGGGIPGRVATVSNVEFGPIQAHDIVARRPTTRAGLFATSPLSASIGIGLLKDYDLDIDYHNRTLAFTPHGGGASKSVFVPVPVPVPMPVPVPAGTAHR